MQYIHWKGIDIKILTGVGTKMDLYFLILITFEWDVTFYNQKKSQ